MPKAKILIVDDDLTSSNTRAVLEKFFYTGRERGNSDHVMLVGREKLVAVLASSSADGQYEPTNG
jgi:hypothetical protein